MLSIRTNVASVDAQRNLSNTTNDLNSALSHLSSGFRITSASDDAAGLAISENLKSQVSGANQAVRNAQDGISMVQTAEGGMSEQTSMLQRMRELGVEGANDTLSGSDRSNINAELQQLLSEFNGESQRTRFNGQTLLSGSLQTQQAATSTVQAGGQFNTTGGNASISSVDVSSAKAGDTYTFTSTAAGTLTATRGSDNVAQTITLAAIGANGTSKLDFSSLGLSINVASDAAGKTAAGLATDLAAGTVVTSAAGTGSSATLQIGANASDAINVSFGKVSIDTTTTGFTALNSALSAFNTASQTNSATAADSQNLISAVDTALSQLSASRANLGAVQNRLGHAINNLQTTSENLTASQSRITDVDVASETARMTSDQVLAQAGVSVLAQANQIPQMALKLLQG
ncbi:MAG TPA: flagellin [Myxococcales bacterium]|nr:flagellin [Myxococcales bacterium]